MSQQIITNNNGVESSQKAARGQWDDARRLAAVEAMISFRPFEQKHTLVQSAWDEVFEVVNETSPSLHHLGSSSIRNYINAARKEVKEKLQNDRNATGTNDSETTLENRIRSLDELVR